VTTAPKRQPIPFGKYLLLDRVNIGGMAEVWRGKTFGAGGFERVVAIKRILPNIAEDEEFISMFIDEAKITVQLNHANIGQVYELAQVANSYFIAMEYISGKDMRAVFDRCRKKGEPAPIPLTCYGIAKCCEGLDYAHRQKDRQGRDMTIVHRDVSPQNALISYDGEVKVIDFGIAKAAGKATKTQAGILKGKFGYMSPEQIRGLPLDRRSDVFAIGICLYEMLTGERLFVGDSDFSVLEKVRKVEVLPPTTYNRKIPDALEKIVMKALAKDVDERYQYASELGDDLQRFLITSDSIFSRKDLAQYMKATFAEEYEREKQRMMEYGEIRPPEGMLVAAEMGYGGGVPPPTQLSPGSAALTAAVSADYESHDVPLVSPPSMPPAPTLIGVAARTSLPRSVPAPTLTPTIPTSQSQPNLPQRTPSMPRLTAAAPMLTSNEKDEHTLLADGQEMFGGQGHHGSTDPDALLDEVGNAATMFSMRTATAPAAAPILQPTTNPDAEVELMTEMVRPAAMGKPLPPGFGMTVGHDVRSTVNTTAPVRRSSRSQAPPAVTVAMAKAAPVATVVGSLGELGEAGGASAGETTRPEQLRVRQSGRGKTLALVSLLIALLAIAGAGVFFIRAPAKGLLYVEIPPDALVGVRVNINGKEVLDETQRALKPGPHLIPVNSGRVSVMVVAEGYETVLETVDVKEGNEYTRLLTKMRKK
jgi:serine/threonine protein kinase